MKLDVGCGANPTGDVNVDLLVHESDYTWTQNPHNILNFVKATAEFLPFQTDCFDEVYSSHLLEHLDEPNIALNEMFRVSRHTVRTILPFKLFNLLDIFNYTAPKYIAHLQWLKKHHKHSYWNNPLHMGHCKLKFPNVKEALLYKKKAFGSLIRIPIPFETETVIIK